MCFAQIPLVKIKGFYCLLKCEINCDRKVVLPQLQTTKVASIPPTGNYDSSKPLPVAPKNNSDSGCLPTFS